jgi:hypothetical protein
MRTVADFRRAAVAGSVWQCTNHIHPHVSGERRITGGTKALKYTGAKADGTTFSNGSMDIPRRADVRIEGDSITWLNPDGSDAYTWTLQRDEPAEETGPVAAEGEHPTRRTGQPEGRNPRFLLAPASPAEDYTAHGAVVIIDGRYIGHDTTGRVLFDRKDMEGAMTAAKGCDLRLIAYGYYGVDVADADTPAPDIMRRREAERAAKAGAEVAEDRMYTEIRTRRDALMARPDIAGVAARMAAITDEERAHLHAAWLPHYRMYRPAQSSLSHRCQAAYGQHWRDVLQVADQAAGDLHAGPRDSWGAVHAAADYVKALVWGDLLTEDERPVFVGPWRAVIGKGEPRAVLRERTEAFVSAWAGV